MINPPSSPSQGSPPPVPSISTDSTGHGSSIRDAGTELQVARGTSPAASPPVWLLTWLTLLAGLPALAVLPGWLDGRLLFTLYREPKLIIAQLLLWPLLAALAWQTRAAWPPGALQRAARRPASLLLALFVLWCGLTVVWTLVRPNAYYELIQLVPLTALLVVLMAWGDSEPRVAKALAAGLIGSLAVATAVGWLQLAVEIPWLPPIDPQYGVANPSLMGYKNPMALALLGQVFLLAGTASRPRRWGLRLLLGTELVYLATLQSRTAMVALLAGAGLLTLLALIRRRSAGRRGLPPTEGTRRARPLLWIGAAALLFLAAGLLHPGARERIASVAGYAAEPGSFLTSDRGVYLRNTVHMASHRPLGVGLGDWQTHYPVFRQHDRFRSFTDRFQARRAHSDHVQVLGETGWPGLLLWLAFLAAVIAPALRRFLIGGDRTALFAGVQVAVVAIAMATDYVVEMPYHRLQFFLVAAIALIASGDSGPAGRLRRGKTRRPRGRLIAATAVTALALAAGAWSASNLLREWHAARLEARWAELVDPETGRTRVESPDEPLVRLALERLERQAESFLAFPGHTKTQYRDHLLLAHLAFLLDDRPRAERRARHALALHPHHPNTLRLLAAISGDDPARSLAYRRGYRYLMGRAETGLSLPLPPVALTFPEEAVGNR